MSVFETITDTTLDKLICTISNITPNKKTKPNQKTQQQVISEILFFAENIIANQSQQEIDQEINNSISSKEYNKNAKNQNNHSNLTRNKALINKDNQTKQNLTRSRQSLHNSNLSNISKNQKRIKQLYSSNKFDKLTKQYIDNQKQQPSNRVQNFKVAYKKKLNNNNNNYFQTNSLQLKHKNSESSLKSLAFSKNQKLSDHNQSSQAIVFTQSRIDIPGQQIKRTQSRYLKKSNYASTQQAISKLVEDMIKDNSKQKPTKNTQSFAKKINSSKQVSNLSNIYSRSKELLSKKQNFIKKQQLSRQKKQMQQATFKPRLNLPKTQLQNFQKRLDQSKQKKIINKAKILKEQLNKNTFKPKINKVLNNSNISSKIKPVWVNQNHQITQIPNSATKSFFSDDNSKTFALYETQKQKNSTAKRIAIHLNDDINYLLQ